VAPRTLCLVRTAQTIGLCGRGRSNSFLRPLCFLIETSAHPNTVLPFNAELKSRTVKEVARVLKAALGVGREEDDTGIFTMCIEIDDGQWATGEKIPTLSQLMDNLGGYVSEQRRAEMSARYPQKR
jgi:hypothetical protein